MKIYCDTSVLPCNVTHSDPKTQRELCALKKILKTHELYGSAVVLRELMETKDDSKRADLHDDYKNLCQVSNDEQVLGFYTQSDQYGGFITQPIVSDVHDESICRELIARGLTPKDAQHITQAVCNGCDVFLTRDEESIIKPHRAWLENRLQGLKVRLPSELIPELN